MITIMRVVGGMMRVGIMGEGILMGEGISGGIE